MSKSFRQSQSFLHTWSGLLLGWVLFVIFMAGTIAFWREGLNRWMRPELDRIEQPYAVLGGAQRFLQGKAPGAKSW
nr:MULTISPECIES: PepSY-associated TM helix domain-containing protein [unclassified Novosphingobium]